MDVRGICVNADGHLFTLFTLVIVMWQYLYKCKQHPQQKRTTKQEHNDTEAKRRKKRHKRKRKMRMKTKVNNDIKTK